MKLIYTTLNSSEEARKIGKDLLEKKLANCVNFSPITSIYNYNDEITEEPEVVLMIKTIEGKYKDIETVVKSHISYDNFIGELDVGQVNSNFEGWLCSLVK